MATFRASSRFRRSTLKIVPPPRSAHFNPDYKNFISSLTADFCKSYEIDGVMWGSERQGPLNNAIGASHSGRANPNRVTCFCKHHRAAARDLGINVERAIEGYKRLAQLVTAAQAGNRPTDGYFVTFWRLLVEYPELLAWEKLWTDGKHAIYRDVYDAAKTSRPAAPVGFHIWHANSFAPFFRAEQDYAKFATCADELKIVAYNLCGGPRYTAAHRQHSQYRFPRSSPRRGLELLQPHPELRSRKATRRTPQIRTLRRLCGSRNTPNG